MSAKLNGINGRLYFRNKNGELEEIEGVLRWSFGPVELTPSPELALPFYNRPPTIMDIVIRFIDHPSKWPMAPRYPPQEA